MASRALEILLIGKDQSASAALGKLGAKADETGKKTETFGSLSTKALAAVGVAAVGLALKSADTFQRIGGEVLKLQRYTGDTAQEASRLRFAAQQSGVDIDTLSKALGIASKNMLKSKDSVADFGVAIKDAGGQTRPMHDVLFDLSDRFASMPNGADKTALALKTFGRAGAELIPMLNKGSAGLGELEAKAKSLGLEFNDEQINKVKAYKGAQRDLTASLESLQVKIGGAVVPMLTSLSSALAKIPGPVMDIAAPVAGAAVGLLGVAAAGKKVWDIVSPLVDKLKPMNASLKETGESSRAGSLRLGGLVIAIGAVVTATAKMKSDSDEANSKLFKGLDFTDLEGANAKLNETGQTLNALGAKWDSYSAAEKLVHAEDYKLWNDGSAQQEVYRAHLDASIDATHRLADATGMTAREAEQMVTSLHIDPSAVPFDVLLETMTKYRAGALTTAEVQDKLKGATEETTDAMKSQADEMKAATDPMFAMQKALDANQDAQDRVAKATRDETAAQKELDYATLTTIVGSQQRKDAYDKVTVAQDALSAANETAVHSAFDVQQAQDGVNKAVAKNPGLVQDSIMALQLLVSQGLINQSQADAMSEKFNNAGAQVDILHSKDGSVPVSAPGIDNTIWKLAILKGQLAALPTRVAFTVSADSLGGSAHASGGSLTEGWNVFGEHGPEMGYKDGSNVYVTGAGSNAGPRGGGGGVVHNYDIKIVGNGNDVDGLIGLISQAKRRGTRMPWDN